MAYMHTQQDVNHNPCSTPTKIGSVTRDGCYMTNDRIVFVTWRIACLSVLDHWHDHTGQGQTPLTRLSYMLNGLLTTIHTTYPLKEVWSLGVVVGWKHL